MDILNLETTFMTSLLGGYDMAIQVMFKLMASDYYTGVMTIKLNVI